MRFCAALSADNTDARPERAHNVRLKMVKASVVSAPVVGEAMTTGLLLDKPIIHKIREIRDLIQLFIGLRYGRVRDNSPEGATRTQTGVLAPGI